MFKALPIAFDSPYSNTRTDFLLCQMKLQSTPKWTYITILTKNKSHLDHFDHVRYPYMSLSGLDSDILVVTLDLHVMGYLS